MKGQGARLPDYLIGLIDIINSPSFVRDHPDEYYKTFCSLIKILDKHKDEKFFSELYNSTVASVPKDIAVHDTFTIYALIHPEKIKTRKVNLNVGKNGEMFIEKGDKHNLVIDLNYEHFKEFLKTYLK